MLKRIKLIEGVGNYIKARSSSYEFNNMNVIYGENRHGKVLFVTSFILYQRILLNWLLTERLFWREMVK